MLFFSVVWPQHWRDAMDEEGFKRWLAEGVERGYCSMVACSTHEGLPMTAEEQEEDDPCIFAVRVFPDGKPEEMGS